jgi:sugar/nucleoside kinase (ribokinase family)
MHGQKVIGNLGEDEQKMSKKTSIDAHPEIIALGEILVDMIPSKQGHYRTVSHFEKCFGGAPFNFAVGVSRLGGKPGAICAVGDDQFGDFLVETLRANGVDTSQVKIKKARTTLAFVIRSSGGERAFFFYRKPWTETADTMLSPEDIDPAYISRGKILHCSGVILSHNPARKAALKAIEVAKRANLMVSFDPNLRLDLWKSKKKLLDVYDEVMQQADILLMSKDEATLLFKRTDLEEISRIIFGKYSPKYVAIKLGSEGCCVFSARGEKIQDPAFKVRVKDTTGAGDAWASGFEEGIVEGKDLKSCVKIANATAALSVSGIGAISSIPSRDRVSEFLMEKTGFCLPPKSQKRN